ncbi:SDR family oxidoreductase [Rhodobacteraceae bacterium NNCM2]|nr:SDR family oxidoreductase [Coraliihabitans acroporae]
MPDLSGKTALITGASRGIGAATARVLAGKGASVVLTARTVSACEAEAEAIRQEGGKALALACDVSKPEDVAAVVAKTIEDFGRLDILVNNAGVIEPIATLADSDPAGWGHAIDINLKGVYYGIHAALPHMTVQGGGSIITISSGAAHGPMEGWSHYCTSKAAANMLNRCLHLEYGQAGIRAMGLSPGTVATEMQREIKASGVNPVSKLDWEAHIPADWPARTIAWMCTADADEFLGEEISLRAPEIRKRVGLIS